MKKVVLILGLVAFAGCIASITRQEKHTGTVFNYQFGQGQVFDQAPGVVAFKIAPGSPYAVACAAMAPAAVAVVRDTLLSGGVFERTDGALAIFFGDVLHAGARAYEKVSHNSAGYAAPEDVARFLSGDNYPIRFDQDFNTAVDVNMITTFAGRRPTSEEHIRFAAHALSERVGSENLPAAGVVFTGASACRTLMFIAPQGAAKGFFALYDSHADVDGNVGSYLWVGRGEGSLDERIDQMIAEASDNGRWWIQSAPKHGLSTVFIDVVPEGTRVPAAGPAAVPGVPAFVAVPVPAPAASASTDVKEEPKVEAPAPRRELSAAAQQRIAELEYYISQNKKVLKRKQPGTKQYESYSKAITKQEAELERLKKS